MSLLPDSLQSFEGWMKKCSRLLAIPKLNRVEKDCAFRSAFESEPVLSIGLAAWSGTRRSIKVTRVSRTGSLLF